MDPTMLEQLTLLGFGNHNYTINFMLSYTFDQPDANNTARLHRFEKIVDVFKLFDIQIKMNTILEKLLEIGDDQLCVLFLEKYNKSIFIDVHNTLIKKYITKASYAGLTETVKTMMSIYSINATDQKNLQTEKRV